MKILPSALAIVNEVTLLAESVNNLAVNGLSDTERKIFAQCLNKVISNLGGEKDVMEI